VTLLLLLLVNPYGIFRDTVVKQSSDDTLFAALYVCWFCCVRITRYGNAQF
jgi:hypothetical protein